MIVDRGYVLHNVSLIVGDLRLQFLNQFLHFHDFDGKGTDFIIDTTAPGHTRQILSAGKHTVTQRLQNFLVFQQRFP